MISQAQDPLVNPADMTDPENQRKTAANILTQLGLHPDQTGARDLLDQHFQGLTAHPEVKALLPGVGAPAGGSAPAPTPPVAGAVPETAELGPAVSETPSKSEMLNQPGGAVTPHLVTRASIPGPSGTPTLSPLLTQMEGSAGRDIAERDRLIETGSGISQKKNPFLRFLGHAGEIAADVFAPGLAAAIPGTEWHHGALVNNQNKLIKSDLEGIKDQSAAEYTRQRTAASMLHPGKETELSVWRDQNPGVPIREFWAQKQSVKKLTPDEQVMKYLTMPVEEGGEGVDPLEAEDMMQKQKAGNRPPSAAAYDQKMQALITKANGGELDPKTMQNPQALADMINNPNNGLTDEERGQLAAHFVYKTSPASAGGIQQMRSTAQRSNRLWPAITRPGGESTFVTPLSFEQNPQGFIPATQGQQAMTKEAAFADIHYNIDQVQEAMNNLKNGFSPAFRGQLALLLGSEHPSTAVGTFLNSAAAGTLTEDQVDFVTSLASLSENAMMMRSIQGMGQGSQDLRTAIRGMLPGAGTPDPAYGNRQLGLLRGTVSNLEKGLVKSGIPRAEVPQPAKTGQSKFDQPPAPGTTPTGGKTFTKAQVQEQADKAGISYEAAKADAIKKGHKVIETNAQQK